MQSVWYRVCITYVNMLLIEINDFIHLKVKASREGMGPEKQFPSTASPVNGRLSCSEDPERRKQPAGVPHRCHQSARRRYWRCVVRCAAGDMPPLRRAWGLSGLGLPAVFHRQQVEQEPVTLLQIS